MEERGEKKTPIAMDWSVVMPSKESDPPAELVVVRSDAQSEVESMSDHDLKMKIARLRASCKILSPKLADKGEKLRRNLKNCEEEQQRRHQLRLSQEDECQNSMQSRSPQSPDVNNHVLRSHFT